MGNYSFSTSGRDGFVQALNYYSIIFEKQDVRDYANQIFAALDLRANQPQVSPVIIRDAATGIEYRQVKVWKFYFIYQIENGSLVVDKVIHEASYIQRLSDLP